MIETERLPQTPASLTGVIERVGRGDHAAFAELYEATSPRAFGVALAVLRNRSHAEDVTQEAYLTIWRNANRFNPTRGNPMSWVNVVVHGAAVNRVRSTQRRSDREMRDHHLSVPEAIGNDPTSDMAIARTDAGRVHAALAQLSAIQRESIELAFFGGYTHVEISETLGVPLGTAKARIRDGLHKLHKLLCAAPPRAVRAAPSPLSVSACPVDVGADGRGPGVESANDI